MLQDKKEISPPNIKINLCSNVIFSPNKQQSEEQLEVKDIFVDCVNDQFSKLEEILLS